MDEILALNPTLLRSDMRYWRLRPDARLHPGVHCYWVAFPNEAAAARSEQDVLLPDGYAEIVFMLAGEFERFELGAASGQVMCSSYVIGGRSHSICTRTLSTGVLVGVKLKPQLLRQLIRMPLSTFRDSTLLLTDLNNAQLLEVQDRLADAESVGAIAAMLDDYLLQALGNVRPSRTLVDHLLACLHRRRGMLSIMGWMHEHRTDARNFERRFCDWVGMTPKRYARILRFKHSYHRFLNGEANRGAAGLHLSDYYDQSHFNRDFRYFLGTAPSKRLSQPRHSELDITEHLLAGDLATNG